MQKQRIHYFQHVHFEGLGCIEQWISKNGHQLSCTRFHLDEALPEIDELDWLIVMGGPMGVNDNAQFPWLAYEKAFIKKAINAGKTVIGICLGSQLLSSALGAKVHPNDFKEIGWFDVSLSPAGTESWLFKDFGQTFKALHWHGDTFEIPDGARHLISSEACKNQCFSYGEKVLALQFHFEATRDTLSEMIENGRHDLVPAKYVQDEADLLKNTDLIEANNRLMFSLLDKLAVNY